MLSTTFNRIKAEPGSAQLYKKLAAALGGVTKYGKENPIFLDKIIASSGLADTIWTMRCTIEPSFQLMLEFACRCAEIPCRFSKQNIPTTKGCRAQSKPPGFIL